MTHEKLLKRSIDFLTKNGCAVEISKTAPRKPSSGVYYGLTLKEYDHYKVWLLSSVPEDDLALTAIHELVHFIYHTKGAVLNSNINEFEAEWLSRSIMRAWGLWDENSDSMAHVTFQSRLDALSDKCFLTEAEEYNYIQNVIEPKFTELLERVYW